MPSGENGFLNCVLSKQKDVGEAKRRKLVSLSPSLPLPTPDPEVVVSVHVCCMLVCVCLRVVSRGQPQMFRSSGAIPLASFKVSPWDFRLTDYRRLPVSEIQESCVPLFLWHAKVQHRDWPLQGGWGLS